SRSDVVSYHIMIKAAALMPAATPIKPLTSTDEHQQIYLQLPYLRELSAGVTDTPSVKYPGMIGTYMQSALVKILLGAGIIATPNNDSTDSDRVLVFARFSDLPTALQPS
ncbi:hypothetical protein, partial [Streptomyces sp. H27-H5]|uniref:hypothetical protein n=1 Tax=Streptomyces sp. H27-H5 TaxID=2996460 RepID=UPI0022721501